MHEKGRMWGNGNDLIMMREVVYLKEKDLLIDNG